jgi:hypothetical protein
MDAKAGIGPLAAFPRRDKPGAKGNGLPREALAAFEIN